MARDSRERHYGCGQEAHNIQASLKFLKSALPVHRSFPSRSQSEIPQKLPCVRHDLSYLFHAPNKVFRREVWGICSLNRYANGRETEVPEKL